MRGRCISQTPEGFLSLLNSFFNLSRASMGKKEAAGSDVRGDRLKKQTMCFGVLEKDIFFSL